MDVGEDTTLGDGDVTQELVQLLIVADGKLQVTGDDTGLLVVTGGVTSQLENLSSEVLENSSEVDGGTGTDTLSVVALAEQTVDTTNGEGQTSLGRTATKQSNVRVDRTFHWKLGIVWISRVQAREMDGKSKQPRSMNLRLSVLAAASLATRLSASHFDVDLKGWGLKRVRYRSG